ncbi:hypothetical protein E4T56_gene9144, partial [Termitomyces sp. T112]
MLQTPPGNRVLEVPPRVGQNPPAPLNSGSRSGRTFIFGPFNQQGAGELNVLKPHLQSTVFTLLDRNASQREIHRLTGVDRKTIRRYRALRADAEANSPGEVTTGPVSVDGQIPPPRPPASGASGATAAGSLARSACEPHRTWIEEQVRLKRNAQAIYQDL